MRVAVQYLALTVSVVALVAGNAKGATVFSDDFEGQADFATTWNDGEDHDLGVPPIGGGWTVVDGDNVTKVQVMRSPVTGLSGAFVFDTPSGSQFLHQWRDGASGGEAWAGIGAAGETTIATNGTMRLSFDFYNVVGPDGYGGNYNVDGFDSGVGVYTGRAYSISFRANGDILTYLGSGPGLGSVSQPALAAAYNLNAWNHVDIDADFTTDTWSVTLNNSATVSGLPFGAIADDSLNLGKIQYTSFSATDAGGNSGRMGLDNVLIASPVPEPSGILLISMGVIAVATVRRQGARLKPMW